MAKWPRNQGQLTFQVALPPSTKVQPYLSLLWRATHAKRPLTLSDQRQPQKYKKCFYQALVSQWTPTLGSLVTEFLHRGWIRIGVLTGTPLRSVNLHDVSSDGWSADRMASPLITRRYDKVRKVLGPRSLQLLALIPWRGSLEARKVWRDGKTKPRVFSPSIPRITSSLSYTNICEGQLKQHIAVGQTKWFGKWYKRL